MRQLHCNHAWYSRLYTLATRCHTCTAVTLKYTEASSLNPFFALDIFICSFRKCIQHTTRGQSNFPLSKLCCCYIFIVLKYWWQNSITAHIYANCDQGLVTRWLKNSPVTGWGALSKQSNIKMSKERPIHQPTHKTIHPPIGGGVYTYFKSSNRIEISWFI